MQMNRCRMEENFQSLESCGKQIYGGGVTRLAFSDSDWEARGIVIRLMEAAGLKVRIDAFGNVIGRREGKREGAPVVMTGSHIDSVPNGGNFDGVAGVLAAIEAVHQMQDQGIITDHPIEVIVFMAEESSRFGAATLGSKAFCGKLSEADLAAYKDSQGITLMKAMEERGLDPEQIAAARYPHKIKAFVELHIEQGKVLETLETQIGVVTAIAAPSRFRVVVDGQADHSGATPMHLRHDALTAAAEIILAVEETARAEAANGTVGTVGMIKAEPGVMNVIPGRVELGIDIRGICGGSKRRVIDSLFDYFNRIRDQRGVAIQPVQLTDDTPVLLSRKMTECIAEVCGQYSFTSMLMPSGAGHDAMHLAEIAPAGMIFIPSRGGISHNAEEWTSMEQIGAGTTVLLHVLLKLANSEYHVEK